MRTNVSKKNLFFHVSQEACPEANLSMRFQKWQNPLRILMFSDARNEVDRINAASEFSNNSNHTFGRRHKWCLTSSKSDLRFTDAVPLKAWPMWERTRETLQQLKKQGKSKLKMKLGTRINRQQTKSQTRVCNRFYGPKMNKTAGSCRTKQTAARPELTDSFFFLTVQIVYSSSWTKDLQVGKKKIYILQRHSADILTIRLCSYWLGEVPKQKHSSRHVNSLRLVKADRKQKSLNNSKAVLRRRQFSL